MQSMRLTRHLEPGGNDDRSFDKRTNTSEQPCPRTPTLEGISIWSVLGDAKCHEVVARLDSWKNSGAA